MHMKELYDLITFINNSYGKLLKSAGIALLMSQNAAIDALISDEL